MKKCLALLTVILAAAGAGAQSIPASQSRVAGRFVAYNYGLWNTYPASISPATGSQTFTVINSYVNLGDGRLISPFSTNAPLRVGTETVTPSAVANCFVNDVRVGVCQITATFTLSHSNSDKISSATFGLQEALNDAGNSGGGAVTVDSAWAGLGGTTTIVNAATIPASTSIEDVRTGVAAGSGTVSGQASGVIPLGTAATTIGSQSHMDDGVTTAGTITSTEPHAAPNFSVNSLALGYASPNLHLINSSLVPKMIMWTGDSTVAVTTTKYDAMCNRTYAGQEFFGMMCVPLSTYSIDGSHNVTAVGFTTLPSNCIVGAYVTITATGTASVNMVGSALETFQITATPTTSSFTFNNPSSAGVTGSTAASGNASCSFINNGSNGQTQAGFNNASGLGSLAFVTAQKPALNIHRGMGINDVRTGTTSLAQLTALIKTYIDTVRSGSPLTDIMLLTENSLLTNDALEVSSVTSPTTTSSTAVGGAGSVTITLAAQLNAINGLVTSDLSLAQEVANTQLTSITATTGTCSANSTAVTLASGTAYVNGTIITIAGADPAAGTLTTQIQSGGGTVNIVVFPQCTTAVSGVAVAQSSTVYSAHLLIDTGAAAEIVPITAISGSTVTATFANAHSGTYNVKPTMATMAQGYSNIIHDAVMSFVGYAPNVQVFDTQTHIYGRLVQAGSNVGTFCMGNQLHPTISCQNLETAAVARIINQAKQGSGAQGAVQAASLPTVRYGGQTQYSPASATIAQNASYSACWTTGYYQCVEDPQYYTLISEGTLNSYTSSSFIRVAGELNSVTASGAFGALPCQPYDIVEFVGYGVVQLASNSSCVLQSTFTQISNAPAVSFTMPSGSSALGVPVRIYRQRYVDASAEILGKSPLSYKGMRYVNVRNSSTTGFSFLPLANDPSASESPFAVNFNPAVDKLIVQGIGDLSTIIGSYTSMTCTYSTAFNGVLCTGGTSVPTMNSAYGQAFYGTQNFEQYARGFQGSLFLMAPLVQAAPPADGTNVAGNNQMLQCGQGTGTAAICQTIVNGPALGTASGTSFHTQVVRAVFNDTKSLTSGAATTLVSIPLATLAGTGGNVAYHLRATDGTNTCVLDGVVAYSAENSAAVFVTNASKLGTEAVACTSGSTLTDTFAVTSANPALLQITPTTSMTATTFSVVYEVHAMGESNVTP